MLLEIMTICSLVAVSPFYDCSETWEIRIYSVPPTIQCNDFHDRYLTLACANLDRGIIHMVDAPDKKDEFGQSILKHELRHLYCRCNFHN